VPTCATGRADGRGAPSNKGMKLTSVEHTERSQLNPGVLPVGRNVGSDFQWHITRE
jgi:hypothetical protein